MSTARISRNEPCPCGSGKKFKHCCHHKSFNGVPQPLAIPTDGAFLGRRADSPRRPPPQLKPITRVTVEYSNSNRKMDKPNARSVLPIEDAEIIIAHGNVCRWTI